MISLLLNALGVFMAQNVVCLGECTMWPWEECGSAVAGWSRLHMPILYSWLTVLLSSTKSIVVLRPLDLTISDKAVEASSCGSGFICFSQFYQLLPHVFRRSVVRHLNIKGYFFLEHQPLHLYVTPSLSLTTSLVLIIVCVACLSPSLYFSIHVFIFKVGFL